MPSCRLCCPQHNSAAAKQLYSLSRSGAQEFPLAVVSMNLTKWAMQVRAGWTETRNQAACLYARVFAGGRSTTRVIPDQHARTAAHYS